MSVKAVKKYYDEVAEQYHEMLELLQDVEKEAMEGIVEPERIDRLQSQIAPIKQNYERLSYIMFLLNQPQRASKQPRYAAQNKKLLKNLEKNNSLEAVIQENKEALKTIGE